MMTITLLIIGYVLSVLLARKVVGNWYVENEVKPDLFGVISSVIPFVNIVTIAIFADNAGEKIAYKFFGIKVRK